MMGDVANVKALALQLRGRFPVDYYTVFRCPMLSYAPPACHAPYTMRLPPKSDETLTVSAPGSSTLYQNSGTLHPNTTSLKPPTQPNPTPPN